MTPPIQKIAKNAAVPEFLDEPGAEAQAEALLDQVLALARQAAPDAQALASVTLERFAHTRFARSELTTSGEVADVSVGIQLSRARREAVVQTNQTDPASLRRALDGAARLLGVLPENPEALPLLGPQRYLTVPPGVAFDPALARLDAAARTEAARSAIELGRRSGVELAGFLRRDTVLHALGTSAGLRARHRFTTAQLTMTARTSRSGQSGTGSGWAGALVSRRSELDVPTLARTAIDKATRSQKPQRLAPGRYTVVLEPAAVAELLGFLTDSLGAREADEGRSCFARPGGVRLGEALFPDFITLRSDPADPLFPTAPFDGEGLPCAKVTWLDRGTLAALHPTRFWAQKKGRPATGRPAGFHLLGGKTSLEELVAGVARGVLITRLWYSSLLDPQSLLATAMTRDGVFLIEGGRVVAPVNNFRINESPLTMLARSDGLTRETVRVPDSNLRVPGLRTHDFNLSAVSEAV